MRKYAKIAASALALSAAMVTLVPGALGQEAKRRYDQQCEVRKQKFDKVLPKAMRDNGIDMWLVPVRDGSLDPNVRLFGKGFVVPIPPATGYYVFTDRGGDRIERVTINIEGEMLSSCPTYDSMGAMTPIRKFIEERNPRAIGINIATEIGHADGLTHTLYENLVKDLGPDLSKRLVSAEKLNAQFRSTRVMQEIVNFGEAGEFSRTLAERALSNEVIVPDQTTLAEVAWWLWDRLLEKGLESSFEMPSIYILGPGAKQVSNDTIIRRGDLLAIDWGVGYQNMYTDIKRTAYVLKPGEYAVPPGIQRAYDKAKQVRTVMILNIKSGYEGKETLDRVNTLIAQMPGFSVAKEFRAPTPTKDANLTQIFIGPHSVADSGHGSGASMVMFTPVAQTYKLQNNDILSMEIFSYTPIPEWGGKMLGLPLEDDGVVTPEGVQWIYPPNNRIVLVH